MSNSVEQDVQVQDPEQAEGDCGPSCSCNAGGLSPRSKTAICLVVGLAAVVVIVLSAANKSRAATAADSFVNTATSAAMASPVTPEPAAATAAKPESTAVWGPTLSSLASLNELAADKDAVFVFLPAKDGEQTRTIRGQIKAAVEKAQSRGSTIAAYMLSRDAEEYAQVTSQVPAPCVLAMVKGAGAIPVSGEITEAKLLEGLVEASRPSSCGPSGCGPSDCG